MSLIICTECSKEFSDKADNCPNCGYIKNMKVTDIRAKHLDGCIKNAKLPNDSTKYGKKSNKKATAHAKERIKSLLNLLFDYALFHELTDKNYARLFTLDLTYNKYRHRFEKVMKWLVFEMQHRPHDTRHTFITLAKNANMNKYAIKMIVSHAIKDIAEIILYS